MGENEISFFFCIIPSAIAAMIVVDSIRLGAVMTRWGRQYSRKQEREGFWMVVGLYALAALITFCLAMKWAYMWYKYG